GCWARGSRARARAPRPGSRARPRTRAASPRYLREIPEVRADEVAHVVEEPQAITPHLRVVGHHEHVVEEARERIGELLRCRDGLVELGRLAEPGERAVLRLGHLPLGLLGEQLRPQLRQIVLARLAD